MYVGLPAAIHAFHVECHTFVIDSIRVVGNVCGRSWVTLSSTNGKKLQCSFEDLISTDP